MSECERFGDLTSSLLVLNYIRAEVDGSEPRRISQPLITLLGVILVFASGASGRACFPPVSFISFLDIKYSLTSSQTQSSKCLR